MTYPVMVQCWGDTKKNRIEQTLTHLGLRYAGYLQGRHTYSGSVSSQSYRKLDDFCTKSRISLQICNEFAQRSDDYRYLFFQEYQPFIGDKFFCAYCGKLIPRHKLTIDHLYPVNCAKKSLYIQKKLRHKGYRTINDVRNLVPACAPCNKRKGANLGPWLIRGQIGRHAWLWVLRHAVRTLIFAAFVLFAVNLLRDVDFVQIWHILSDIIK